MGKKYYYDQSIQNGGAKRTEVLHRTYNKKNCGTVHILLFKNQFRFVFKTFLQYKYVYPIRCCMLINIMVKHFKKGNITKCGYIYLLYSLKSIQRSLKLRLLLYCLYNFYPQFQKMNNQKVHILLALLKNATVYFTSFYNIILRTFRAAILDREVLYIF